MCGTIPQSLICLHFMEFNYDQGQDQFLHVYVGDSKTYTAVQAYWYLLLKFTVQTVFSYWFVLVLGHL